MTKPITKNYDSEFCGSIPTHLINLIQPHGVLLVLDKASLRIVQASENTAQVLGWPASELLEQPLSAYLAAAVLEDIRQKTDEGSIRDQIPMNVSLLTSAGPASFTATMHARQEYTLMELEPVDDAQQSDSFVRVYQETKYIMGALKEATTTESVGEIAVPAIKKLSGFDRVMLYQFDKDWNGTVVAEAREPDLEPYLHLRFPASDVPKQTRELYFRNPYRLIPNRDFTPVKLLPVINPLTRSFTDLSECALRGVPSVHVEYLKNMRVAASMSTPIIIGDRLWGLISCHHQTPKYLDYEMRSAFELLSNVIAAQLSARDNEQVLRDRSALDRMGARLVERIYAEKDLASGLLGPSPNLSALFRAGGTAILFEGELTTEGNTPPPDQIRELIRWLQLCNVDKLFTTDRLPETFAQSASYAAVASGLIALPISVRKGEYILGFRPEVIQNVAWGGDPNQAIQFEPDRKTYHPRNSFAIWREKVQYTATPWLTQEVEAAENLRVAVLERILKDKNG